MRSLIRVTFGAATLLASVTAPLAAQVLTTIRHPAVSSVSPRSFGPGQTVTIRGTDLKPDTVVRGERLAWTVVLQYRDKYSGALRELPVGSVDGALTFQAPAGSLAPDESQLIYRENGLVNAFLRIAETERTVKVKPLFFKEKPRITTTPGTRVSGPSGSIQVLAGGAALINGRDLLRVPGGTTTTLSTRDLSTVTLVDKSTLSTTSLSLVSALGPPTVTLGGTTLPVSSAVYAPFNVDEVRVSTAALPHNTTGFLTLTTSDGSDSALVTVIKSPANARLVQFVAGVEFPVTSTQLIAGSRLGVRADNLFVEQRIGTGVVNRVMPLLSFSNVLPNPSLSADTTVVTFTLPAGSGELSLSHAGGRVSLGTFTVIPAPSPLAVTGAVIAPSETVGGNTANLTVSLSPTPTNFSTAGSLIITIPASLSAVIDPIAPIPVTANPMVIPMRTKVTSTTFTGAVGIRHSSNGTAGSATVTVRPPRPTSILVSDTVAGGSSFTAFVAFDQAGSTTVALSSSDPSLASLPASASRTVGNAPFLITTTAVSGPRTVTIFASLDGTSVSRTLVLRPGRLTAIDPSGPHTVGQAGNVVLAFDIPVSAKPVALTSNDTALVIGSTTVTGTSGSARFTISQFLAAPRTVTITATADGVVRTGTVQLNPLQLTTFQASPTSGAGGSNTAVTLRLSNAAVAPTQIDLLSSDATVVQVPANVLINGGSDVLVIPLTFVAGAAGPRTATVTATLKVRQGANMLSLNTRTITLTVTP